MFRIVEKYLFLFTVVSTLFISSCQKKNADDDKFASVNGKVIAKMDLGLLLDVRKIYPSDLGEKIFPGKISNDKQLLYIEALYKKANSVVGAELKRSTDWSWKYKYYIARNYLQTVIMEQWGYSTAELQAIYNSDKEKYKVTQTLKKSIDNVEKTYDTTFYREFDRVRSTIALNLFKKNNAPDSVFQAKYLANGAKGDLVDSWLKDLSKKKESYFRDLYFKEKYGVAYSGKMKDIFGYGKPISPEDIDVLLSWAPANQKTNFEKPDKQKLLAEWLLSWKLFVMKARENGYAKNKRLNKVLDLAWKYEVVVDYINSKVLDSIIETVTIDTSLIIYQNWDKTGIPYIMPNEKALETLVSRNVRRLAVSKLTAYLSGIWKKSNITYFSDKLEKKNSEGVDELLRKANKLVDEGKTKEAEESFKKISSGFAYTEAGVDAFLELAKLQGERSNFRSAIKNYRNYLLYSDNSDKLCSVFFRIAYIYGEHLKRDNLAEANYKWILKNSPDCELADDAEFLMLHIGEPMIEIEELQAEAKRQGKSNE